MITRGAGLAFFSYLAACSSPLPIGDGAVDAQGIDALRIDASDTGLPRDAQVTDVQRADVQGDGAVPVGCNLEGALHVPCERSIHGPVGSERYHAGGRDDVHGRLS